jgi:hypothetical protein
MSTFEWCIVVLLFCPLLWRALAFCLGFYYSLQSIRRERERAARLDAINARHFPPGPS